MGNRLNIQSPIAGALQGLQNASMEIWRDMQRRRETDKTRKLRYGLDSMKVATSGLNIESSPEDFQNALNALDDFEDNKYLGNTSKIMQEKVESMKGIADERVKTIADFEVMLDESKKAGGDWATGEGGMEEMLNTLKDVRLGDLKYLTGEDKSSLDAMVKSQQAELTTKSLLSNLLGEDELEAVRSGQRPAGMDIDVYNSVKGAHAFIEAGDYGGALGEIHQLDTYKSVANARAKLANQGTEMISLYRTLPEYDAESSKTKQIETAFKSKDYTAVINEIDQVLDRKDADAVTIEDYDKTSAANINTIKKTGLTLGKENDAKKHWGSERAWISAQKTTANVTNASDWDDGVYVTQINNIKDTLSLMMSDWDLETGKNKVSSSGHNLMENVAYLGGFESIGQLEKSLYKFHGAEQEKQRLAMSRERIAEIDFTKMIGTKGGAKYQTARNNLRNMIELLLYTEQQRIKRPGYEAGGLNVEPVSEKEGFGGIYNQDGKNEADGDLMSLFSGANELYWGQ